MKKFLIIDPFIHFTEHTLVDRALIEYFSLHDSMILVNETMKCECDDLQCNFIKPFHDFKTKIKLVRLCNREIIKTLYSLFFIFLNLFHRRRIVFLALSQFQWFFFSIICTLCRFQTSIVMHHYAEAMIKDKKKLTIGDRMFLLGKKIFTRSKHNTFLYLSKHIKENLLKANVAVTSQDFFINHPIPLSFINRVPFTKPSNKKHVLATIGLLSKKMKSSDKINDLKTSNNIELWMIGRLASTNEFKINDNIKTKLWSGMYSTHEFEDAIKKVDSFLYFFTPEQYQCTASGTLIDAILYCKGVVCLNNDAAVSLLENYDDKIIFNSIDEMSDYLRDNKRISNGNNTDTRMKYCLLSECCGDISIVNRWASVNRMD
ncbi:hypothetical protein ACM2NK_09485 [Escherichia coli]|uniref:hypothetical protein n=1 Tax=Escherichia TaxID=561 RepID=UPI000CF787AF|nr:hypothetical protein [Escherichia sp. MOD1-EC5189]EIY7828015.1 hypothetical protein [Escherichia coli]